MPKDKLVLDQDRDGRWLIGWYLAEDEDIGACLGEGHPHSTDSKDENDIASRAAFEAGPCTVYSDGYRWESRADVHRALRAANAALADARSKVPLPDWAKQALAAGWKMPKGWKPC